MNLFATIVAAGALGLALPAAAQGHNGALVRINPQQLAGYLARHNAHAAQIAPNVNLYWVQANDGRNDSQFLGELQGDSATLAAEDNSDVSEVGCDQSGMSVLNESQDDSDDQSGMSVLNQSAMSVLNTNQVNWYGSNAYAGYLNQPAVSQINAVGASRYATGKGQIVAVIDDGVDPGNTVLAPVLLNGYNFFSNSPNWSCYADLQEADDSDDQSGMSVLNDEMDDSDDQSGMSVLNDIAIESFTDADGDDQSGMSVLNDAGFNSNSSFGIEDGAAVATGDVEVYELLQLDPEIGHGTAVAGLVHLVAPQAQILPIKAFGPQGTATLANIVASIYYAINHGANVINMSFSSTSYSPELSLAIAAATRARIVLISAAGNGATPASVFPAAYSQVLGVAALNPDNTLAAFSNYGSDAQLAAPGVDVISTFPDNQWCAVNGTSFSSPLVAGEAALLLSSNGHHALTLTEMLMSLSANPNIPADRRFQVGSGVIQVDKALLLPF